MDPLTKKLGYQFENSSLLTQAMTHPSRASEDRHEPADNQRLEFLGDAVIQVILTKYLYCSLPDSAEGSLTKIRASLVSKQALASCARRLGLGEFLRLGKGEEASGGRDRDSNLADALESLLGAVFLDGGLAPATAVAMRLMDEDLINVSGGEDTSNPKGRLQEVLQAIQRESPVYRVLEEEGPDHLKEFRVEVLWNGKPLGRGGGSSKKNAETAAAQDALERRSWES
ncbi:MAG: ribonuclease III [Roseibacillus sp.]|nr:ribonuclease III [Roseibacillus sp.]|tara:strand:- start:3665 stop:4348 length:684 start_codon:yes stop_codon:yes gene_type:complete